MNDLTRESPQGHDDGCRVARFPPKPGHSLILSRIPSTADVLTRLANLKGQGAITDAEFEQLKAKQSRDRTLGYSPSELCQRNGA